MIKYLNISVRFLDNTYHGLCANGRQAEWPPSPFRLFQAIIAGNSYGSIIPKPIVEALKWLELLSPPDIFAPHSRSGRTLLNYVLNNRSDSQANSRTQKMIRPTMLNGDRHVQYVWGFDSEQENAMEYAKQIIFAVGRIRALGWGIDLAVGHGIISDCLPFSTCSRLHFRPTSENEKGGLDMRVPCADSMRSLQDNYSEVLRRFEESEFTRLESANAIYQLQSYESASNSLRPFAVFELFKDDGSRFTYPHSKFIHITGMVRHLAIELMKTSPPQGVSEDWVRTYIAGHRDDGVEEHRQFSYLPLPSIGHPHADPAIRRVMISAPIGDSHLLRHLAMRLGGEVLEPLSRTPLVDKPFLQQVYRGDNVSRYYTNAANRWASVTPVILPGHDDHKAEKTVKLIQKALLLAGIEQPCEFEWSAFSYFPKSLSAHKYKKDETGNKQLIGYIRPNHLLDKTAVHLQIKFNDGVKVPGPLVIGAGRHCGFGLMAGIDN